MRFFLDRRRAAAAAPRVSLALLLVLLASSLWITPDVYYHLFLGRAILESGRPQPPDSLLAPQPGFVNIYWVWQLLGYGAYAAGGPAALAGLVVALWLATAALWARTAGLFRRPAAGLPIALLGLLIFQIRLEPRPEALSYLLLALQLHWLQDWDFRREALARQAAGFFLSTALWTNVHGYFALAPLVVGARWVSTFRRPEARATSRSLAVILAATVAGTFASPFGPGAWREVAVLWRFLHAMRHEVLEFGPPAGPYLGLWTVWIFWLAWAATGVALVALALRRRLGFFAAALAAAALYLSASAVRNLPLLPLLAAPLWRDALAAPVRRAAPVPLAGTAVPAFSTRLAPTITALAALALCAWVVQGGFHRSLRAETRPGIGPAPHAYASGAADHLERIGFRGKLFNSAADGGYLEFRLREIRPFMDSRYTDVEPVVEYFRALREPEAFDSLDAGLSFDGVLLRVTDSPTLLRVLLARPQWKLAYADLHRALFLRRDGPWGSAPAEAARLYRGEDLGERVHGRAAIQWILILRDLGRRDLLRAALSDFGRSARVPSFVLQHLLEYALHTGDRQLRDEAASLRDRMVALRDQDRAAVERLLATPLPPSAGPSPER